MILKRLAKAGILHGDAITVTGRTIGEEAAARDRGRRPGGRAPARRTRSSPKAGWRSCAATSPPKAPWSRSPAPSARRQTGPARVFESEEDCFRAVKDQKINAGDIVVIRNEGPVGGPGMREMLQVTAAIVGEGLGEERGDGHRRPLLRRHPRADDRPRRPRGGQGRPDRGDPRGRRDHRRHRRPPPRRRPLRRGDRQAGRRVRVSRAALHPRRDGQVRGDGLIGREGAILATCESPRAANCDATRLPWPRAARTR